MSDKDSLGLGGAVPPGQEAIRLFSEAPMDQIGPTFATDDPYLLADGTSLIAPIPATVVDDGTYVASDGSLQGSIGAPGPYVPSLNREIPFNSVTVDGVPVTNDGAFVTNG